MERLVIKPIEDQLDGIDNLDQMSGDRARRHRGRRRSVQDRHEPRLRRDRRAAPRRHRARLHADRPRSAAGRQERRVRSRRRSSRSRSARSRCRRPRSPIWSHDRIVPDIKAHPERPERRRRAARCKREFHVYPDPLRLLGDRARRSPTSSARSQQNNANLPGGRLDAPTRRERPSRSTPRSTAPSDMLGIPPSGFAGHRRSNGLHVGDVATPTTGTSSSASFRSINGAPTRRPRHQPHHHRRRDQVDRRSRARSSRRSRRSYPAGHVRRGRARRPTTRRSRSTACCRAWSKASS